MARCSRQENGARGASDVRGVRVFGWGERGIFGGDYLVVKRSGRARGRDGLVRVSGGAIGVWVNGCEGEGRRREERSTGSREREM